MAVSYDHGKERSASTIGEEFSDLLRVYVLLMKNSAVN
jgi:hypothetical protein